VQKRWLTKSAQKVVQPRSSSHPPPGMSWCFPVYSLSMCCPTQMWGGTAMNPYYWPNPFTYLGWGHHKFFPIDILTRQTWPKRMQSERLLCIKVLSNTYIILSQEPMTWIELSPYFGGQNNSSDLLFPKCAGAFGSPSSTKRQGACVEHQKWRTTV
jgi:hypothetical protein